MNIYVGNLPFKVGEEELKNAFEAYGEVDSVKIITDKFSGRSKGFAFVEMPDDEQATKAINEINNSEIGGRNVVVNQARQKTENRRSFNRPRY